MSTLYGLFVGLRKMRSTLNGSVVRPLGSASAGGAGTEEQLGVGRNARPAEIELVPAPQNTSHCPAEHELCRALVIT